MSVLGDLIEARVKYPKHVKYGVFIGRLYTDHGFPIDMAFDRLDMSNQQKLAVLQGACGWLVEHKRNSGATDKAIERQRKMNNEITLRFIKTGETGVY